MAESDQYGKKVTPAEAATRMRSQREEDGNLKFGRADG